jgi:CubicO group peptidase (beta-lactamase class C family)
MSTSPLPRSTPAAHGLDPAAVSAFLDGIDARDDLELHSLMILRHGQVITEGWWAPYSPDQLHLLYSLSKSFTSTAVGFAVAEGKLSLRDRIVDIFDDLADAAADDRVRSITLDHVLRMASGHRVDTLQRANQAAPDDLVRGFLSLPPDEEPGSIFCYNNGATFAAAAAVQKRAGQTLTDYLTPRLFAPLGIDRSYWQSDVKGRNIGFSGLHLTTESIARFGQFVLQRGRWQDQQLLSAEWFSQATSKLTDNSSNDGGPDWRQGYGYQFWMARHGFRGDGAYGQFCVVLPEQDVVVVTTAGLQDMQGVLDLIWEHLLPAFDHEPLPADGAASSALEERLATLSLTPVGSTDWTPRGFQAPSGFFTSGEAVIRVTKIEPGTDLVRITLDHDPLDPSQPVAPLTFSCGLGRWLHGEITVAGWDLAYAGSATYDQSGRLDAELAFVQTPHRLRIRGESDGTTEVGWLTEPLGPPFPEVLATRRF